LFAKRPARPAQPLFRLGSLGLEVFVGSPIPGQGELGFCASDLRISPVGICTCSPGDPHAGYVEFSDLAEVKSQGTRLVVGSQQIAHASSEIHAKQLVEQIHKLKELNADARGIAIKKEFRRMLSVPAAKARWSRFRRITRWLDWNARALLFVMLVVIPLTIWFSGWRQALPIVAVCLGLSVRQIFTYLRVDRIFQKPFATERRTRVVTMVLSPPAAVRVRDYLSRDLFVSFHPLAVARATCDEATSHRFASQQIRRLLFPADFEKHNLSCPAAAWFNREWRSAIQEWTQREFRNPESLIEAPIQQNPASLSYCPRCVEEFVVTRTECPDCVGVGLRSFTSTTSATQDSPELSAVFSGQERHN
jgi:hypothetical protein